MLLDGKSIELRDDVLVIADERGPVGLAGIMGGQSTAVSAASTSIFFEGAFFSPAVIAGRARRFGLHTDASLRFERGVDPTQQARAVERATELLLAICGGEAGPLSLTEHAGGGAEALADPIAARARELRARTHGAGLAHRPRARAARDARRARRRRLARNAARVSIRHNDRRRPDRGGRKDGRLRPDSADARHVRERLGRATEAAVTPERAADRLAARGYSEVITYSFVDAELEEAVNPGVTPVRLANPIASDMAVLRRSLWPGLHERRPAKPRPPTRPIQALRARAAVRGGRAGRPADGRVGGPRRRHAAGRSIGTARGRTWISTTSKATSKSLLHLTGRAAEFRFEAATHPALSPAERRGSFAVPSLSDGSACYIPTCRTGSTRNATRSCSRCKWKRRSPRRVPAFRSYSKFPSIRRDLAIVVEEKVPAATVVECARAAAGALLQHVIVFDVYRGSGVDSSRKSIGLGLILQDVSRTLTDADADQTMQSVTLRLERELRATIRT